MSVPSTSIPKSLGRPVFLIGIAVFLAGIAIYFAIAMGFKFLHTPWYMPALGTLGALLILAAIRRRPTVSRWIGLVLITLLAGFEWWFIVFYTPLPPYQGPIAVGQSFPAFTAELSDGKPFTQADFAGKDKTILVFFRGHW